MTTIRVPATSANLGPGFDSCGIALSQYLTLEILAPSDEWYIEHNLPGYIPHDTKNLVLKTALSVCSDLKPYHLKMETAIPAARGLGSSSTAIVAGIELANYLGKLNLTQAEKVTLATEFEGHPDNVAPAICGNFVVATYVDQQVYYVKHEFPPCDLVVFVPNQSLLTSESRNVLPKEIAYKEGVKASSIGNVMIAALLNKDLDLAGSMMEKDLWHETYREKLVPHLTKIRKLAHEVGAYGSVLSGAGPTVLTLCPPDKTSEFIAQLNKFTPPAKVEVLAIDTQGTQVIE